MAEETRTTLALIEALMDVWLAIRAYHPGVPDVVLLPAPAERGQGNVLGHFAALRWNTRKEKQKQLHEVVVVAEHLNRPPEDTDNNRHRGHPSGKISARLMSHPATSAVRRSMPIPVVKAGSSMASRSAKNSSGKSLPSRPSTSRRYLAFVS